MSNAITVFVSLTRRSHCLPLPTHSGIGVGCGFGVGWGFGGAPIGFAGLGAGGGCGVGLLALGWGWGFSFAGAQYLPETATFSSRPSLLEKLGTKVREAKEHGARIE